MNNSKEDIKELIDKDDGLRSKRRMLTIISLILLAIQFSGAKIVEANTFILKLSFEHQNGITVFLLLAIIFLLLRYYNYARPYHEKLNSLWTSRLMKEGIFVLFCEYTDSFEGLIFDLIPDGLNLEAIHNEPRSGWTYEYQRRWFFRRYIKYDWHDENPERSATVSLFQKVPFSTYLEILWYEWKHQIASFFTHRENLDIMAPYFIGIIAISSYFFSDKIQLWIEALL